MIKYLYVTFDTENRTMNLVNDDGICEFFSKKPTEVEAHLKTNHYHQVSLTSWSATV